MKTLHSERNEPMVNIMCVSHETFQKVFIVKAMLNQHHSECLCLFDVSIISISFITEKNNRIIANKEIKYRIFNKDFFFLQYS